MPPLKVEVYQNQPPGRRCSTMLESVRALAAGTDVAVEVLPFPSTRADARGITEAPALVVNGLQLGEGAMTPEQVREAVAKARAGSVGILLTKSPFGGPEAERALDILLRSIEDGAKADLFLLSDGVLLARAGLKGRAAGQLARILELGAGVLVSGPHLTAAGFGRDRLVPGVEVVAQPYDRLVDFVMGEHGRILSF